MAFWRRSKKKSGSIEDLQSSIVTSAVANNLDFRAELAKEAKVSLWGGAKELSSEGNLKTAIEGYGKSAKKKFKVRSEDKEPFGIVIAMVNDDGPVSLNFALALAGGSVRDGEIKLVDDKEAEFVSALFMMSMSDVALEERLVDALNESLSISFVRNSPDGLTVASILQCPLTPDQDVWGQALKMWSNDQVQVGNVALKNT